MIQPVMSGTPVTIAGAGAAVVLAVGVRLGAAAVAGAILGLDRDLRHKPAGLRVHGLTTAASIWVAACLGIAAGVGLWPTLLGGSAFTLAILVGGARLERAVHRRLHPHAEAPPLGVADATPRPASSSSE